MLVFFLLFASAGLFTHMIVIGFPAFDDPVLEFPIVQTENVYRFSPYGIMDYDGPNTYHSGIDIKTNATVDVRAPVGGTIIGMLETPNTNDPDSKFKFSIILQYNWKWFVIITLEPNIVGNDNVNNTRQRDSILVSLFQKVRTNEILAQLLYLNGTAEDSHIHYVVAQNFQDACPYDYSSASAKLIYDSVATQSGTNICLPIDRTKAYFQAQLILCNIPLLIIGFVALIIIVIALFRRRGRKKTTYPSTRVTKKRKLH